jgi:hypothetical protein
MKLSTALVVGLGGFVSEQTNSPNFSTYISSRHCSTFDNDQRVLQDFPDLSSFAGLITSTLQKVALVLSMPSVPTQTPTR